MPEEDELDMAAAMEAMDENGDMDMAALMEGGDGAAIGNEESLELAEGDTLSQDEIDSLLGFDSRSGTSQTGIQALLDRSQENYERLPMLEVVFDRFVRSLSTAMRNLTGENVDVNIESITSMRFEDYLNSVPLPALIAIFQAVEWENFGLITIDSALTYSMVDILLGGGRTHRPVRIEGRPFTTIEQDIIKNLARLMLEEMSAAFNPLTPATFRMERLETNPRFATITRPSNAVILISLRVEIDDRGGLAEVLLPYVTLEPIKELLVQMFAGELFGGTDMSWEMHFTNEVGYTEIPVLAKLSKKVISLRELANLRVGSTLIMNEKPAEDINIECKGLRIMRGQLGASGKNLAVNITRIMGHEDDA